MPKVTLQRDSGYADSIRRYKVFLDGNFILNIASGESQTFDVLPGEHTIQVKIDWGSTPRVPFRAAEEPVVFKCFSKLRGPRLILAPLAVFNPRGRIGIRRVVDVVGVGEPDGAADQSQPVGPETNRTWLTSS